MIAVAALLLALSVTDATATLALLESGCEEANPVMRRLLDWGVGPFLAGKLALTTSGLGVLLVARHQRFAFRSVRVGNFLPGLAIVYAFVNAYEVALLLWR